jgi:uncharacterized repeat protein (TIGR03803 family)
MSRTLPHRNVVLQIYLRPTRAMLSLVLGLVTAAGTSSAQAQRYKEEVLHTFTGEPDGAFSYADLVRDTAGNLYGTTAGGGSASAGTVFKVDSAGAETILYSFTGGPDGFFPNAGLVRDVTGTLYGTTADGGSYNFGTVFKLDKTSKKIILHNFTGTSGDGEYPYADLILDAAGNLYGTAVGGGSFGYGIVFKLDKTGKETVLYSFTGSSGDGAYPYLARLVRDDAGNFYGTTSGGGSGCKAAGGCGTAYKLDKTGKETVLHRFTSKERFPWAGLIRDAAGNLYGTTHGSNNCKSFPFGTVFELNATGKETVLHRFTGTGGDGACPDAGVVSDGAGNFYGTTSGGGAHGFGTVFKVTKTGTETVLYSFSGKADGATPWAGLIRDEAGNLYGTTNAGGTFGAGTVFKLAP